MLVKIVCLHIILISLNCLKVPLFLVWLIRLVLPLFSTFTSSSMVVEKIYLWTMKCIIYNLQTIRQ